MSLVLKQGQRKLWQMLKDFAVLTVDEELHLLLIEYIVLII